MLAQKDNLEVRIWYWYATSPQITCGIRRVQSPSDHFLVHLSCKLRPFNILFFSLGQTNITAGQSLCILSCAYSALLDKCDLYPNCFPLSSSCSWNNMHPTCLPHSSMSSVHRLIGFGKSSIYADSNQLCSVSSALISVWLSFQMEGLIIFQTAAQLHDSAW